MISTPAFDEEAIADDIRETVRAAADCNLEIVMKDIHTISDDVTRPARWVQIARDVCEQAACV